MALAGVRPILGSKALDINYSPKPGKELCEPLQRQVSFEPFAVLAT
jgi:hypothetical protein